MSCLPSRINLPSWAWVLFSERARYKIFYGGRGSGKSWAIARALLIIGSNRKIRVLCAREFQRSIEESVHKLLENQIASLGLENWEVQDQTIVNHRTKSEFIFAGLHRNVESIQSLEAIDYCWVEEAQRVSDKSWKVLIPTIRKAGSEIWISFNPAQENDPTYQRFVVNPPAGSIVCKISWRDNPWLPDVLKAELEHLRRVNPEEYQHVWEGEVWSRSDAQIFAGKWHIDYFEPGEDWFGPYHGCDFGFSVTPLTLGRQWIYENNLYVDYSPSALNVGLNDHPEFFDKIPGIRNYTVRADCARPETINHMQSAGFDCVAAEKWPGSVEDGIVFLQGFEKIIVHPRCKKAENDLRLYSYKVDKLTGDVLKEIVKKHDDWVDQCRYALDEIIRSKGNSMLHCL